MALQNVEANITLDLYNHDTTPATVKAIQLDSQTRYVAAMLQNMGAQYDVDSGATVQLIVIRPDKVGVQITGTTFTYGDEGASFLGPYAELTQVALAVNGKMRGQFKITSGNQILRTEIFAISTGEALDASTDEWADEYDGYNLEEMATSIATNTADIATIEADVSQIKEDFNDIKSGFTDLYNTAYVTDSASGAVAHFVDGADDVPMKSVKVNIAPVQSGSGDPSPDNVRPITGWEAIKIYHSGADTEEATEYEVSLASAGTVYGGTLDVVSGELTVEYDSFLFKDAVTARISYSGYNVFRIIPPKENLSSDTDGWCEVFKTLRVQADRNNCIMFASDYWSGAQRRIIVKADEFETVEAFKERFGQYRVVYRLRNPITYKLTPAEVKSLLGINNIWSDAGDVDVEYRADTKLYIDKRLAEVTA